MNSLFFIRFVCFAGLAIAFRPSQIISPTKTQRCNRIRTDNENDSPVHLAFQGGGIFFYWQAGVVTYLREQGYDLSKTSKTGASAGALVATLTACDVDFYRATDVAMELCKQAGVWNRSGGLQGVWGPLIRDWLDEMLPDNAVAKMEQHDASLLVTPFPFLGKQRISSFKDRQDLIDCNMASVHLPFFLDGQFFTTKFRDQSYIDGSFLSTRDDYKPLETTRTRDTLFLNHKLDETYNGKSVLDFVDALSPEKFYEMIEQGRKFAKKLEDQGKLSALETTSAWHRMPIFS